MAQIKKLIDQYGVIFEADKILPAELRSEFLKALAELEKKDCYVEKSFPHTNLHKVTGFKKKDIYRAYINKVSGWRLHVQYSGDDYIILKDIICGKQHDDTIKVIKAKIDRYD